MRSFHSTSRAWPSSSMSRQMTAAPCSFASRNTRSAREPSAVAVLEVGRVEHASAAEPLQPGLHHRRLGGVEHDGHRHLGGEPGGELGHVGHPVAAHVVDAQVEQVGGLLHLVLGDLDAAVPVLGQHGVAERPRPVGIGALPDDQEGRVLVERGEAVDRGGARLDLGLARRRDQVGAGGHHRFEVFDGGAAAAADHVDPELGDIAGEVSGQLVRGRGRSASCRRPPRGALHWGCTTPGCGSAW